MRQALTTRPRRLHELAPRVWAIENPQTGLLKTRPFMQRLGFVDATYCLYGTPFKKQTRFWTNMRWAPNSGCLVIAGNTGNVVHKLHEFVGQQGEDGDGQDRRGRQLFNSVEAKQYKRLNGNLRLGFALKRLAGTMEEGHRVERRHGNGHSDYSHLTALWGVCKGPAQRGPKNP